MGLAHGAFLRDGTEDAQVQDISQLPRPEQVLSFQTGTMESLRKLVLAPT